MFEDVLVESGNRIRTRSRYWVLATTSFNVAVLAAMVLYPMLYPQALPKTALVAMIQAPPPPPAAAPKPPAQQMVQRRATVARLDPMVAPPQIPVNIRQVHDDAPPPSTDTGVAMGNNMGGGDKNGVASSLVALNHTPVPLVHVEARKPTVQRVSAGVMAGQILVKTQPLYPAIARAAGVSGVVVLHAIISKQGTIENLSVVSGPEMLRGAAVDAVKQWRYRPYMLGAEPTDVDTTITVNFSIGS